MFLITGCGKGIGRETLKYFCESYNEPIVGIYRSDIENISHLNEFNSRLLLIKGDVSEENIYSKCLDKAVQKFNALPSKFVINAGMRLRNNLEKVDSDTLNKIWQINYFSLRNILKTLVLRDMISKDISLVYISSIVSSLGFKDLDDYGATKAASESLIRSTSSRFSNSRFNSIAPGFTKTSYAENFKNNNELLYDWTISRTPMNRWGNSEEIVYLIDFLLSSKSSFITGQTFKIDGGWSSNA